MRAIRQQRATLLDQVEAHEREGENWAKGSNGEDILAETLADRFGDEYTLLRNYTPPAPSAIGGDIDAVLLGPHGVIVFEVKAWTGEYLATGRD
ncbi:MAG TPA: nuclease-related domain-containing protein, partial [Ktedonobacterales bacterium]|nr:nuclease-related domain-containing protein [Ktedonobacterales bacterium]